MSTTYHLANGLRAYYGDRMMGDGSGYVLMWLVLVLLIVLAAFVVYLMVRHGSSDTASGAQDSSRDAVTDPTASARAILAERLAEGDIDVDDYRSRVAELDGPPPQTRGKRT